MSASAGRRSRSQARAGGITRRRRQQHLRRLRRDFLTDAAVAVVLAIIALTMSAGLGVVAMLEVPVAGLVLATVITERRVRRKRKPAPRRRAQRR
ncbi:MAG: hypothetical protein JO206_08985 [Solirubrobacterales bacterium]|nr:hypothetical protein [Solirubrobacterales bacterium]MBV9473092.1 hypothetical protein [Solirubrobacterales bacterium]